MEPSTELSEEDILLLYPPRNRNPLLQFDSRGIHFDRVPQSEMDSLFLQAAESVMLYQHNWREHSRAPLDVAVRFIYTLVNTAFPISWIIFLIPFSRTISFSNTNITW